MNIMKSIGAQKSKKMVKLLVFDLVWAPLQMFQKDANKNS